MANGRFGSPMRDVSRLVWLIRQMPLDFSTPHIFDDGMTACGVKRSGRTIADLDKLVPFGRIGSQKK
jgi:hypothetical protein